MPKQATLSRQEVEEQYKELLDEAMAFGIDQQPLRRAISKVTENEVKVLSRDNKIKLYNFGRCHDGPLLVWSGGSTWGRPHGMGGSHYSPNKPEEDAWGDAISIHTGATIPHSGDRVHYIPTCRSAEQIILGFDRQYGYVRFTDDRDV
ncbi:unnamed protein product [Clonostachys byssicola]|uniref:Uncharacterized protein n=1 Tax=Clonostachys byssicola TaxID=160290 RepID=A0A9N9UD89_9HYPO|nr:unnamed protein product [Clonostachys byssicola]